MKQKKSLASNSAKKKAILIGCAVGSSVVVAAGVGIGVGYAIWHSNKESGGGQPITPTATKVVIQNKDPNIPAEINTGGSYQFIATGLNR